jgi:hypothetical protein
MSMVTNAILVGAGHDLIQKVNCAMDEWPTDEVDFRGQRFLHVDHGACGGHKNLEVEVGIAAFNYLDADALLRVLQGMRYEWPESLQLFLKFQDADAFIVYMLHPDRGMVPVFAAPRDAQFYEMFDLTR